MAPKPLRVAFALAFFACVAVAPAAVTFSIAPGPSPFLPDDLLNDPTPTIAVPGAGPNVDGISYGRPSVSFGLVSSIHFSVGAGATGIPGSAVATEFAIMDEPADIYSSPVPGAGTNFQTHDGDGSSAPALGLIEPFSTPGDDLDALDLRAAGPSIFWSVDIPTSLGGPYLAGGFSAADIFMAPTGAGYAAAPLPALWATAATLGLVAADDIDALAVFEDGLPGFTAGDFVIFSLAAGSPSLLALGPYFGTGADVFTTAGGGGIFAAGPSIGLAPGDELNALDLQAAIPEPTSIALLGAGCLFLALRIRRKA